ncbi:MAG: TonB-dependent receptor [Calditrichaeota bacterium]|nr:MAG: TonB-dependent receptor [Calditrichota bacterium]
MKRRNKVIAWFTPWLVLSCLEMLPAQELIVRGSVRDMNTRREIAHVNIFIEGTQVGTASNFAGRFVLKLPANTANLRVVFKHIAYEKKEIPADSLKVLHTIYLQPRVIVMPGITVEEKGAYRPEIQKDLPQTYSILQAKNFDIRGFTDAGDLLRTDQSIQVEEELSGKKTIGIRGGNPDEVVVLYNGVKLNNTYDNVFDLSLIDLEDIQRLEIIKGSNTALYGPEAFAGVINIVPKIQLDYNVRFQQRFGTYRSGNWGLQINPQNLLWKTNRLQGSYSFRQGAMKRNFVGSAGPSGKSGLENTSRHHTAMLTYAFGKKTAQPVAGSLTAMFIHTRLDYVNHRDGEDLLNLNRLFSLRYAGKIFALNDFNLSFSYKNLDDRQNIRSSYGFLDRDIDDRSYYLNAENTFSLGPLSQLVAYQFQRANMDYNDQRTGANIAQTGLEQARLDRNHHGFVAITKLEHRPDSDFLQKIQLGLSIRHDIVVDREKNPVFRMPNPDEAPEVTLVPFDRHQWNQTTYKFAIDFTGVKNNLAFKSYFKIGSNVKFPTLFQQISSPNTLQMDRRFQPVLSPEKNNSLELGMTLMRQLIGQPSIYGWALSAVYFQNHYDNKFRISGVPGIPVAFYDNVQDARISGVELKPTLYFYRKKVAIEVGLSKYAISEKAAFPFKSDLKRTLNLTVDHAGYSFQALWFYEGEQIGWLRKIDGGFAQIVLPSFSNLDLHLSKTFEISRLKLFLNASGRNLLNSDRVILEGLALRDKRFYITVGAQY